MPPCTVCPVTSPHGPIARPGPRPPRPRPLPAPRPGGAPGAAPWWRPGERPRVPPRASAPGSPPCAGDPPGGSRARGRRGSRTPRASAGRPRAGCGARRVGKGGAPSSRPGLAPCDPVDPAVPPPPRDRRTPRCPGPGLRGQPGQNALRRSRAPPRPPGGARRPRTRGPAPARTRGHGEGSHGPACPRARPRHVRPGAVLGVPAAGLRVRVLGARGPGASPGAGPRPVTLPAPRVLCSPGLHLGCCRPPRGACALRSVPTPDARGTHCTPQLSPL